MHRRVVVSFVVLTATAIFVACAGHDDTSHPPMIGDCASINCTQPPGTSLPPLADAAPESAADAVSDASADADASDAASEGGDADETG